MPAIQRCVIALLLSLLASDPVVAGKMKPDDVIRNFFGKTVHAEKKIKRFVLYGDLDGDKKTDYVYAVRTRGYVRDLRAAVQARDLASYKRLTSSHKLLMKDPLAISLAIILSSQKPKTILLVDNNSPTIFSQTWHDGLILISGKKAAAVTKEYRLKARGSVIVVPTAAGIDTYLYWDGKKFEHYWPEEIP